MKKLILLLTIIFVVSCTTTEEKVYDLREYKKTLTKEVNDLQILNKNLQTAVNKLEIDYKELSILTSGREPVYLLTLELKQTHFTLDLDKIFKDAVNKVELTIPVSKSFYDSQSVGSIVLDKFRTGSFIFEGTIGSWKVTTIKKEIK